VRARRRGPPRSDLPDVGDKTFRVILVPSSRVGELWRFAEACRLSGAGHAIPGGSGGTERGGSVRDCFRPGPGVTGTGFAPRLARLICGSDATYAKQSKGRGVFARFYITDIIGSVLVGCPLCASVGKIFQVTRGHFCGIRRDFQAAVPATGGNASLVLEYFSGPRECERTERMRPRRCALGDGKGGDGWLTRLHQRP